MHTQARSSLHPVHTQLRAPTPRHEHRSKANQTARRTHGTQTQLVSTATHKNTVHNKRCEELRSQDKVEAHTALRPYEQPRKATYVTLYAQVIIVVEGYVCQQHTQKAH